jgi:transcriptional regulatory protein RtcR
MAEVCSRCRSFFESGRLQFSHSRTLKVTANDADRLRKYLARFGLEWSSISAS